MDSNASNGKVDVATLLLLCCVALFLDDLALVFNIVVAQLIVLPCKLGRATEDCNTINVLALAFVAVVDIALDAFSFMDDTADRTFFWVTI